MIKLLPILLILATFRAEAQDVIITKKADTIDCKIENIETELLFFKMPGSDKVSQVPISVLHKYLYKLEWETVGELNADAMENKRTVNYAQKPTIKKVLKGNIQTAGFHIETAAKWQMATPILSLGGIGFIIGGGLGVSNNNSVNRGLLAAGSVVLSAAIVSQIIAAYHLRKAGLEFRFVGINEQVLPE